jgi:PKD repeat protein
MLLSLSMVFISLSNYGQVEIIIKPDSEEGKDSYVNSYYERLDTTQSLIAAAWTYGGIEGTGRSFIQFHLPDLPNNYYNFRAYLNLYYNPESNHVGHGGDNASKLERIIENWTESGVMWYYQPAVTSEHAVYLPASTTEDQDYPNIDVTQLVLDMYSNPDSSFGFRLSLVDETIYRSMILSSSDHHNPDLWPSLVIKYDTDTCLLPSATFKFINFNNAVQFIADSADNGEYWWDFGNGYFSNLKSPAFVYEEPGDYQVCLTVTNGCGSDTYCDTVQICDQTVNGNFSYTIEGNFAEFTPQILSTKVELLWDFGDGFMSEIESPKHFYNKPGKYLVCLIAKNFCFQVIHCDTINIIEINQGVKSSEVLNLYPNPTTGLISIAHGGIPAKFYSIQVINFNGTVVFNQDNYRITEKENGYFCDFTGLESGIYTIHVTTDIGVFTQKAIIMSKR